MNFSLEHASGRTTELIELKFASEISPANLLIGFYIKNKLKLPALKKIFFSIMELIVKNFFNEMVPSTRRWTVISPECSLICEIKHEQIPNI